jgi:hypothetical protein
LLSFQAGDGKLTVSEYADSTNFQGNGGNNIGSSTTLNVKLDATGSDNRISMVGFFGIFGIGADRIPPGATITRATLRMVNAGDGGKQNDVHVIDRAWTESTVTWDSFFAGSAGYGPLLNSIGSASGVRGGNAYTIDLTSVVQDWSDDPSSNRGVLLRSNGVGSYNDPQTWTSGENINTADRPMLAVEYTIDSPFTSWLKESFGADWDDESIAGPSVDPDGDGNPNFFEFALNGDPLDGTDSGMWFAELTDTGDGDFDPELTLTCAVRRGAVFASNADNAQESGSIDGIIYTIEGSSSLVGNWDSPVAFVEVSDTAPFGSGLPDLSGTAWQYHTFSGFNELPDQGFLRVRVANP